MNKTEHATAQTKNHLMRSKLMHKA